MSFGSNTPIIDLSSYLIDDKLIASISGSLVKKYQFMPVFKLGETLTIAIADTDNLELLDKIRKEVESDIDTIYAKPEDIQKAIYHYYGVMDVIEELIFQLLKDKGFTEEYALETLEEVDDTEKDSEIVRLVNLIIQQAIIKRASDIHIAPDEDEILVRLRVDGVMQEVKRISKKLLPPIISRIKVMSGMDIAESRIPQDGHIKLRLTGQEVELRVSCLPTINGENIVMRVLNKGEILFTLTDLGMKDVHLSQIQRLIESPYGMLLVTGPTGSGKTTTLYAGLNELNQDAKNVITLEDPVEFQLPLIRQCQINPKSGFTFSSGLRSILRQDPDIIMVGEIRDLETAELSIRSALTGHMVFSTLHTNDTAGAIVRLIDMGVEPFLVSSSVVGVLAQRLARRVCPRCRMEYEPTEEEKELLKLDPEKKCYKGRGCKQCNRTGYVGRVGLFELLLVTWPIKALINQSASASEIKDKAMELGMKNMVQDGLEKIYEGITSPSEVIKATRIN